MATANELLNNLSMTNSEDEGHIVIGMDRYITVPNSLKKIAVEHDHNIETVTFKCPRHWDEHDLSKLIIYINYRLPNGEIGSYIAKNINVVDDDSFTFTWTIRREVTKYKGNISFLVCAKSTELEGDEALEILHWNTELCTDVYVSEGLEADAPLEEEYPDIVTQLLERMTEVENVAVRKVEIDSLVEQVTQTSQDVKNSAIEIRKRLINFEQNTTNSPATIDSTVAYQKIVPANALPYAEVEKVGGMTRKSANLIKITAKSQTISGVTFAVNDDKSITVNGTATDNIYYTVGTVSLLPNTYYLSGCINGGSNTNWFLYVQDTGQYDYGNGRMLTISDNLSKNVLFKISAGITINGKIKPMLNEGSTALPYEPYYEGLRSAPVTEIESVGANLFDDSTLLNFGFTKVAEHEYFRNNFWNIGNEPMFVNTARASGSFTISCEMLYKDVGSTSSGLYLVVCYTDGTNQKYPSANRVYDNYFDYVVVTDANKTVDYICFTYGVSQVDTTIKNMQIEYGNTASEYKPYTVKSFPIPEAVQTLDGYGWGVNDTCYNYIDWEKKQFVKRVEKVVFDGTETWYLFRHNSYGVYVYSTKQKGTLLAISDTFTFSYGSWGEKGVGYFSPNGKEIFFNSDKATVEDWKTHIAENPVTVYYELAEPIITDISNLITDDNFIEVEGNGMLTFKNEHGYAVPSEIKYPIPTDIGNIETAIDSIIAIQNQLIGGDA